MPTSESLRGSDLSEYVRGSCSYQDERRATRGDIWSMQGEHETLCRALYGRITSTTLFSGLLVLTMKAKI